MSSVKALLNSTCRVQLCRVLLQKFERNLTPAPVTCVQVRNRNKGQRIRDPAPQKEKEKPKFLQFMAGQKKAARKAPVEVAEIHPNEGLSPDEDIWMHDRWPPQPVSLEQAVQSHKELADPTMFDRLDSMVYVDMELCMQGRKQNKFLAAFADTVLLPHKFDDGMQKRVIVICKSPAETTKAVELGAILAGGTEIMNQILKDDITYRDYDHLVTTPEMAEEITPLRAKIKERYPLRKQGKVNENIEEMMELFTSGLTYKVTKKYDEQGLLQAPFGTLNMTTEELKANFEQLIMSVQRHAPKGKKIVDPFISSIRVIAPPSSEKFLIDVNEYLPLTEEKEEKKPAEEEVEEEAPVAASA